MYNVSNYKLIYSTIQQIKPDVLNTNNLRIFSVAILKATHSLEILIVHDMLSEVELNECLQEIDIVVVPSLWSRTF